MSWIPRIRLGATPVGAILAASVASCGGDIERSEDGGVPNDVEATRILFTSDREGNDEIYAIDVSGSDLERLTNDPGHDVEPAWALTESAYRSDQIVKATGISILAHVGLKV